MKKTDYKLEDLNQRRNNWYARYNNYTTQRPSNASLTVYQSGEKHYCEPGFVCGPDMYDHYIIHYVTKGRGTYSNGRQTYEIEAGDAFLILPYEAVTYVADREEPWNYYWVGFNGTDAYRLLLLCGFNEEHLKFSYRQDNRLKKTLARLVDSSKTTSVAQEYALLGCLYEFLSIIMESTEQISSRPSDEYYYRTLQYIQSRVASSELSVQEIADALGLNRSYLYRIFEEKTGKSIQGYIRELRLKRAKLLLTHSTQTVGEVARSCGFDNSSYFTTAYKRYYGHSPLQDRTHAKAKNEGKT